MNNIDKNLSLCITCYDGDYHLLPRTLSFFQGCTKAPDEIIIVSSGIKEENLIKKNFITINSQEVSIIQINSEQRHNQAKARNVGASNSSCEFIMFFDVDDIPHPQKIEVTLKAISEKKAEALVHDYCLNTKNFTTIENFKVYTNIEKDLSCTNVYVKNKPNFRIHHAHITCKTKIVKRVKYNESLEYYRKEDGKFCQDLLSSSIKIGYIDKYLVCYT